MAQVESTVPSSEYGTYDVRFPSPVQQQRQFEVPLHRCLPNSDPDYISLIHMSRVYDIISPTPLTPALSLSKRLNYQVSFKREDVQPIFSFKIRGAYNKIAQLNKKNRWKGVIACSSGEYTLRTFDEMLTTFGGNHAQGVAYAARKLKIPAIIVMPVTTPAIKQENVTSLSATVILHGKDFDESKKECSRLQMLHDLVDIPPFDDPYVIAGQGTIGQEIISQIMDGAENLEAIFCPIGGGGMISGVGIFVKHFAPWVKIIGVETYDSDAMFQSLQAGRRVQLKNVGSFVDGAAVKLIGRENFRLCQNVVDQVIRVTTDEVCIAIKDVYNDCRALLEPAGALAIAGLTKYATETPSRKSTQQLVAVASGANMNFDGIPFISERARSQDGRHGIKQ